QGTRSFTLIHSPTGTSSRGVDGSTQVIVRSIDPDLSYGSDSAFNDVCLEPIQPFFVLPQRCVIRQQLLDKPLVGGAGAGKWRHLIEDTVPMMIACANWETSAAPLTLARAEFF